jgi:GNAT superfamily N-acetyltransferase
MKLPPPRFPPGVNVRKAKRTDGPALLRLVEGLAEYEKLPPPDPGAQQRLLRDMFSSPPRIEGFLGEFEGVPVGYSFVFESYSSFLALPTLYLEDIFVLPEYRGRKVGVTMFSYLVHEAWRRGCGRMEWMVLDWNKSAIEFYNKLGATHMHQWQLFRLVRTDMESFLAPR